MAENSSYIDKIGFLTDNRYNCFISQPLHFYGGKM